MSSKRDYYEILGVKKSATHEEITKAYRELALRHHRTGRAEKKKEAEDRFKEMSEAYAVLSDPQKRALYDPWPPGIDQKYAYEDMFRGTDFSSVFEGMGDFGLGGTSSRTSSATWDSTSSAGVSTRGSRRETPSWDVTWRPPLP